MTNAQIKKIEFQVARQIADIKWDLANQIMDLKLISKSSFRDLDRLRNETPLDELIEKILDRIYQAEAMSQAKHDAEQLRRERGL